MFASEPLENDADQERARAAARRFSLAWLALLAAGASFNTTLQASEPRQTPAQLFQLRNMCSNAAQQAFRSRWSHPSAGITLLGFTNHYDVRTHQCYLLVTYRKARSTWFDASDVQTGKTAAHIRISSPGSDAAAAAHRPG